MPLMCAYHWGICHGLGSKDGLKSTQKPDKWLLRCRQTPGSLGSDETDSPGLPGRMPPGPEDHKDAGWGQASGSHGPARSRATLRTAYAAQSGPGTAALSRSRIHLWCPTSRKIWGSQGFRLLAQPGQRTPQRYRWPRGERPAKRPKTA